MEKIDVICVGTLKEDYLRKLCAEYEKRLSRFCRVTVTEIAEQRLPASPSPAEISRALEAEAEKLNAAAPDGAYRIALCVEGGGMSSERFSDALAKGMERSGRVALFIGSSCGLAESLKKSCALRLSMSQMTFPHQLARCVLFEQLYRAYKIRSGETYHK